MMHPVNDGVAFYCTHRNLSKLSIGFINFVFGNNQWLMELKSKIQSNYVKYFIDILHITMNEVPSWFSVDFNSSL